MNAHSIRPSTELSAEIQPSGDAGQLPTEGELTAAVSQAEATLAGENYSPVPALLDPGVTVSSALADAVDAVRTLMARYADEAARHTADEIGRETEWCAYLADLQQAIDAIAETPVAGLAETAVKIRAYLRASALYHTSKWRFLDIDEAIEIVGSYHDEGAFFASATTLLRAFGDPATAPAPTCGTKADDLVANIWACEAELRDAEDRHEVSGRGIFDFSPEHRAATAAAHASHKAIDDYQPRTQGELATITAFYDLQCREYAMDAAQVMPILNRMVQGLANPDAELVALGKQWAEAVAAKDAAYEVSESAVEAVIASVPVPATIYLDVDPTITDVNARLPRTEVHYRPYHLRDIEDMVAKWKNAVVNLGNVEGHRLGLDRCEAVLADLRAYSAAIDHALEQAGTLDLEAKADQLGRAMGPIEDAIIASKAESVAGIRVKAALYTHYAPKPDEDWEDGILWSLLDDLNVVEPADWAQRYLSWGGTFELRQAANEAPTVWAGASIDGAAGRMARQLKDHPRYSEIIGCVLDRMEREGPFLVDERRLQKSRAPSKPFKFRDPYVDGPLPADPTVVDLGNGVYARADAE